MEYKVNKSDVSIDHLIDNGLFEPQRVAHSYLTVEFGEKGLVDIHGRQLGAAGDITEGIEFTPDNLLRLSLSSHGMPNHSGEVIKIRKGNEEIKFNGQETFEDIDISWTDWIGADIENVVSAWDGLRYNPVTGFSHPAKNYKKYGTIVQYSPDGKIVRTWKLMGIWLNAVKFGEYNRSNNDHREISATIHVDKAYPEIRQL